MYDFDMNSRHFTASDMNFDSEGNAIVVGQINFSGADVFIHKIDLETGKIVQESELTTGSDFISSPKILDSKNGYVLGEVAPFAEPGEVQPHQGFSVSFLDRDFNFQNRIIYPANDFNECYLRSFLPMKNGGFCALSYTCNGPLGIIRLDDNGEELWRWKGEYEGGDGQLVGDLIETSDGGIILVRAEEFNSTGHKIKLIKFDANGNI
jgi:hypothetical protein